MQDLIHRRTWALAAGLTLALLAEVAGADAAAAAGTAAAQKPPLEATGERRFPPTYITTEGHRDVKPEEWTDPRI